jgi:hypothetical protein
MGASVGVGAGVSVGAAVSRAEHEFNAPVIPIIRINNNMTTDIFFTGEIITYHRQFPFHLERKSVSLFLPLKWEVR